MRVLLVEDHKPLARALRRGLEEENFSVDVAADGAAAAERARQQGYDVIVLDLMLPKIDGLTLLQQWRSNGLKTNILVLSARSGIDDRVRSLNAGADDYLTKPFELNELLARLRALSRRCQQDQASVIRIHDLEIDTGARTVKRGGQAIPLRPREYGLLEFLAVRRGTAVTRSLIWERLYDEQGDTTSNVVDVYISYLRNKIDKGFNPPLIVTCRGQGYMLRAD